MQYPKPLAVHVKAIIAALLPMAFAVVFSWLYPLTTFGLARVNPQRVDCLMQQRVFGVIPIQTLMISDLRSVSVHEVQAGTTSDRRAGRSSFYVKLVDGNRKETLTPANAGTVHELTARLSAFLESDEAPISDWTLPFMGSMAAIPAVVSLLFLLLVVPDALKSLRYRVRPLATGPHASE
jgi:hypothetical protein